jgi:hypothetical protein
MRLVLLAYWHLARGLVSLVNLPACVMSRLVYAPWSLPLRRPRRRERRCN